MKLYIYDHCPFCTRARMIFKLKGVPLQTHIFAEDDVETPTKLVGKKMVPILEKEDGTHMSESMDIVRYVDNLGANPILGAPSDPQIKEWHDAAWKSVLHLAIPRFVNADFPEIKTTAARKAFVERQIRNFGNLEELRARSAELATEVDLRLSNLAPLLEDRQHVNTDDLLLFPLLRMLSIVAGIKYPPLVIDYMTRMQMMSGVSLHLDQAI
ncbi:glutaredoxin 2 [Brucella pseudogrignonensis]|uniref:glutaredoxin 2 n=1 Tax=Brucella pseudogrignonensis TaxID=419475 RepID=UPI003D953CD1